MLTRLAFEWASRLTGTRLTAFVQDAAERFRLIFAADPGEFALAVSLDPGHPWAAAAIRRWEGPRWSPAPWVATAAHDLVGRRLLRIVKEPADRTVRWDFGDGRGLVFELAPQRANLAVLGVEGTIVATLRRSKNASARLAPGTAWSAGGMPAGRFDPFAAPADAIDRLIGESLAQGEDAAEALRHRMVGVGRVGAQLLIDEQQVTGRSLGQVMRDRLGSVVAGVSELVIEDADDPSTTADQRLLPWRPAGVSPGRRLFARDGPSATAAFHYEAVDATARLRARIVALAAILRKELGRTRAAEQRVREGLRSFEDPDRYRRMGEALLAGLRSARRSDGIVYVPDPYDEGGRELSIPATPGRTLAQVADELFQRQRRSRRGLISGAARAETLARQASRLERLLVAHERLTDQAGMDALESDMRVAGLPVGLLGPTRASRAAAQVTGPQLSGVRMVTSADGWTILVGRTGPDNDRLTFKIAAPDDFWLHAAGVPGAHVVIRNPDRLGAAPAKTLAQAAGLALWFSDARSQGVADVQCTRRRNVRRAKGGRSGMVVLKRFETLRARAAAPPEAF